MQSCYCYSSTYCFPSLRNLVMWSVTSGNEDYLNEKPRRFEGYCLFLKGVHASNWQLFVVLLCYLLSSWPLKPYASLEIKHPMAIVFFKKYITCIIFEWVTQHRWVYRHKMSRFMFFNEIRVIFCQHRLTNVWIACFFIETQKQCLGSQLCLRYKNTTFCFYIRARN